MTIPYQNESNKTKKPQKTKKPIKPINNSANDLGMIYTHYFQFSKIKTTII
jgi:hypothetical protein